MFRETLRSKLEGVACLSDDQVAALETHYELMVRWNKSLNLTTVLAVGEAVERHYCESIFLAARLPRGALSVADIGSGPGFPGVPVAIFRPDCAVTLIESHQRKAVFLREATRNLPNVRVIAKRAEDIAPRFGRAISRAVSYADLHASLKNLSDSADLLTGEEEPPKSWGWRWESVKLPWGKERFLRQGSRVPRETSRHSFT